MLKAININDDNLEQPLVQDNLSAAELGNAAHAAWSRQDWASCLDILKQALHRFPGDPIFLKFAHELETIDNGGLSVAIAQAYIKARPHEGCGYGTLAAVLNAQYARSGGTATHLLPLIETNLGLAGERGPLDPETELAKCNFMRYKEMSSRLVSDAYEELLQKHKRFAAAYYNYGLHCLVVDYERALAVFRYGAQLAPNDPNFVLGQVRALIKLGRSPETWPLLAQAKKLNAREADVDKIMQQLKPSN